MNQDAPLLTIVLETTDALDKESTFYRRLLSARLEYGDSFRIHVLDSALTLETLSSLVAGLESTYVVFMKPTHEISAAYLPTLLQALVGQPEYLVEPVIYSGAIPAARIDTERDAAYHYSRVVGPHGVAFNTRLLAEFLSAVDHIDPVALYLGYRLFWSLSNVTPLAVGYSVASDTQAAIGLGLHPGVARLIPTIPTDSEALRLGILRLLVLYLRGLRSRKSSDVPLTHLADVVLEYSLVSLAEHAERTQAFEARWLRWLGDNRRDSHLYKQLSEADVYLHFQRGPRDEADTSVPLYELSLPDGIVTISKRYEPHSLLPSATDPAFYNFYSRPIQPSSVILFLDRPKQADDNAEHLYEYFTKNHPEYTRVYFALNPKSADWARLEAKGFKLVPIFTQEFQQLFLASDLVVSSQIYSLQHSGKTLANSRFVYLQHGVQLNDMSDWVISKYFDIFVATGELEAEYLRRLAPMETLNSGLPRFERLTKAVGGRDLVFMPTWRFGLHQASAETFRQSDFFKAIDGLLTDRALIDHLHRTDRTLQVKLHPNVEKRADSFRFSERVIRSTSSYQELLSSAEFVFTDYSSVVIDAAFIQTPIAYYQWDGPVFFAEQPYEARLDYEIDGLGPVFTEHAKVIDHIVNERYLETNAYQERRSRFFEGVDPDRICATIVERMLSL